jgi:23S rRNA (adenine2503-C2)-methyltransferase
MSSIILPSGLTGAIERLVFISGIRLALACIFPYLKTMTEQKEIKGFDLSELQAFVLGLGEKKYRASQLYQWIYAKGARSFDDMTDISKEFRAILARAAALTNLRLVAKEVSSDGTVKFLFGLRDGLAIESVLIPSAKGSTEIDDRLTLCVSTQVGCPLDCEFCATGSMGFKRNLSAGEIVDQVLQAQRSYGKRITNLVYMGMGEPMLNYDNVMKSIHLLNDDRGLNVGVRHITISTAGYTNKIRQMANEGCKVKLALSLHSLDNEKRTKLMPVTKRFPVPELIDALAYYYRKTRRRPTFEYILFDGFNDAESDVAAFRRLSERIPCKVNLIPFHTIEFIHPTGFARSLKPAPIPRIEAFAKELRRADITVMVRSSSGLDINAACGQLAIIGSQRTL